jgi:NADH:ubiquinone oxidoreductase subunit E/NAD-dependent dihydropyrimidine dehydrogenase PreA subunit
MSLLETQGTAAPANGNGSGQPDGKVPCGAVLVCGGGIAGIQASLDLSAAGFRVFLVEESPTIGGGMARLDKTFPTGDCATCIISPKLVECIRDYNIDVLTMADVLTLEGEAGHFTAEIRKRPRSVNAAKCTGCGDCWSICPVRNTAEPPPPFQPSEPLADADAAWLSAVLARHEGQLGNLMPVLQEINGRYGYLPRLMLEHLACLWSMRLAEVLRVASFYDRFHLEPTGRHIVEVCAGTSCHSRNSRTLLEKLQTELGVDAGQTDKSGQFTLRTVRCLGLCALSPALKIDGQAFGRVNPDRVPEILEQFA